MSKENGVVLRNPKNNRRKKTDGYRTDSGCFEDVDLQMANRHSPTSTSSESVLVDNNDNPSNEHGSEECRATTEHPDTSLICSSLADECADDKDFHAILKRLSDITSDPGDLYRLCFSSRLSYCGHMSSNAENGEATGKNDQNDSSIVEETSSCTNCEILNESLSEKGEKCSKRSSHGQQCVELLSLLSSCAVKAKENPGMFSNSSLGNSLVGQLSSLLSTLEEAKRNSTPSNEGQSTSTAEQISPNTQMVVSESTSLSTSHFDNNESPLPQGSNTSSNETKELDSKLPSAGFKPRHGGTRSNTDFEMSAAALNNPVDTHNKPLSPLGETEELEAPSSTSSNKTSFATNSSHEICAAQKRLLKNRGEKSSLLKRNEEYHTSLPVSSIQTSLVTTSQETTLNQVDSTQKYPPDSQDENLFVLSQPESDNAVPEHNISDNRRSITSVTDGDDVVTTGRRAVKPYSWDYGDIWEKELERARSIESCQGSEQESHFPSRKDPVRDMLPSFEEIRDELFQNAGFTNDNSGPSDGFKRRSRSADARPNFHDDNTWPGCHSRRSDTQSPFVRTVYQNEASSSTGLRRSWSSHHIGGNSFMVNVDWTHGRQMTVMTGPADRGFDDVQAQIIKEAVVKTSTFRGPKPWSVLKRKPSGLRRRLARNESLRSSKINESSARTDQDSESSDSPYVSATSSDCLTTATDDSSSITSSHYYAASSLPSSPSVSNRNSACFSDTSTSDTSDIRRVVFQSSSSDSVPCDLYLRGYAGSPIRGMTLDRRFGYIGKHYHASPNEGLKNTSIKDLRDALVSADKFSNENSKNVRGQSSTLPRKWQDDQMISPLLVRSDSDLNRLKKVQFVGDSYSRSRISKNVRHTRKRSQSPSPLGPRTAHTRVVSCEIVQSDNKNRDVYTKVNIAESFNDEEETKTHDGRSAKLGNASTRRSWHGQSPTRVLSRHSPPNRSTTPTNGSTRHSFSSRSGYQQRQNVQFQRGRRDEKQVHATLVSGNNHQHRLRNHWSTASLRSPGSERPRILPDNVVMNRPHRYSSMNYNAYSNFERNSNGNRNRNDGRTQSWDAGIRSEPRPSPPDYLTAVKRSQGLQRHMNHAYFPGQKGHVCSENTTHQTKPKELTSNILKETSFVGPSTFTKYQSSSNPPSPRTRRARSLNEKDMMSRRRLQDFDLYRRRTMEINQNRPGVQASRCDSDVMPFHRPERRRRYSEGTTRRSTKHDGTFSEGFVDASYCDPHRMSIQEGTYSIANAESAHDGRKSDDTRLPYLSNSEPRAETKGREFSCEPAHNYETKDTFASHRSASDGLTSIPSQHKIRAATMIVQASHQNKSTESKSTPTEYMKAEKSFRPKSTEGNNLPALPHEEIDEKNIDVSLRTEIPYINTGESKGNMCLTLTNKKKNKTPPVVHSSSGNTHESSSVVVASVVQQLPVDNVDENKRICSSLHEKSDKKKTSVIPRQKMLPHKSNEESSEIISAREVQDMKDDIADISQHLKSRENLSYVKNDQTNSTLLRKEPFPCKQVDQINGLATPYSRRELVSEETNRFPPNDVLISEQRKSSSIDSGDVLTNEEKAGTNVILSPILPKRKSKDSEVNVFIDYREKRPVSVEFSEEDVSFLKTLGSTARASRKHKLKRNSENKNKTGRNNTSCTVFDVRAEQDVKNDDDVVHLRLSRKDKHERDMLTSKVNNLENRQSQVMPTSNHQPSPSPYRRDSTIVYTDARTSFGSDTDSISRDSTVSSSGSDMTVILHDDMDISAEDLKQLTESGSKIGIEIAPIHVETGDEPLADPSNNPDELPPAMELSKTFTNYQERIPDQNEKVNPKVKETPKLKENSSSMENSGKNNTLKRLVESLHSENLSNDNLLPPSYNNMQSSCSSIASSRASSKSTGTEGSKEKNSSKNGGKRFLSRLKNFRNSFRAKRSDSISFDKNGKKSENLGILESKDHNRNEDLSRRFPTSTDANANVLSSSCNRTKSESKVAKTHGAQAMSRRSYDVFQHPNNDLRRVVGVKSVSSDHLNAYRVENSPPADEITAKSIEVLVETCI